MDFTGSYSQTLTHDAVKAVLPRLLQWCRVSEPFPGMLYMSFGPTSLPAWKKKEKLALLQHCSARALCAIEQPNCECGMRRGIQGQTESE